LHSSNLSKGVAGLSVYLRAGCGTFALEAKSKLHFENFPLFLNLLSGNPVPFEKLPPIPALNPGT
jgi:hypothetical protein